MKLKLNNGEYVEVKFTSFLLWHIIAWLVMIAAFFVLGLLIGIVEVLI